MKKLLLVVSLASFFALADIQAGKYSAPSVYDTQETAKKTGAYLPDSVRELRTSVVNSTGMPIAFSWRSASKINRALEKAAQKLGSESLTSIEPGESESKFHTGDKLYVVAYTCPGYKKVEGKFRPEKKGYSSVEVTFKNGTFSFTEK